ncbi:hypothetical protein CJW12_19700 [Salmonella enterica subsp. enterica serovar Poona]|nr:hypothetical protein [Salmonella enterica subsp. enterica serovar Poona]EDK6781507.1 hypothetical protein [Salmonella enterica]EIG0792510.1 hypothetical protein [Salmonella enterica]EKD2746889.1 hypothetical protein [Salmonella enterica]
MKTKSPAATSAQGKSAVGVTVRLWDYGHKKAPTKSGQGSHVENNELPVMELRCRVPPGDFVNGKNEAVCALEDHEGISAIYTPPHRWDSPQQE